MKVKIRPWEKCDFPLLVELLGNPGMTEYLGGPESLEKIAERHERYCREIQDENTARLFAVIEEDSREGIGWVGYWEKAWKGIDAWETGWLVLPDYQGRGVATSAMSLLIEKIRKEKNPGNVFAFPSVENAPSNRICEKLGFIMTGSVQFEYPEDHFMLCNEWVLKI